MASTPYKRVVLLVLDSVGCGEAADAASYGDAGSHTLKHISEWCEKNNKAYSLPNLSKWGLGELVESFGIARSLSPQASTALLEEVSPGKDTTTGHWEISGTPLTKNFHSYPQGFDEVMMQKWSNENGLPGWLHNKTGSGTQVMQDYGPEHITSGKPIVYTSADSVWQIAAHEEHFGLEKLYEICRSARKYADELGLGLGRVIARPFVGDNPEDYVRTENRRDFSEMPPEPNMLDVLKADGHFVGGIGKIEDIFAHRSITLANHTGRNETSQAATLEMMEETKGQTGLIFTNLIDFDMHYGHRRDPAGYADCLMSFDKFLGDIESKLEESDLLLITADHGNDPTHTGTDHTRENVPLLFYSPNASFKACNHGKRKGFHHIGRLCLEALGVSNVEERVPSLGGTESILH